MLEPRKLIRPTLAVLAFGAVALALLMLPSRGVSIDWGAGGGGEWLLTAYAASHNATCTQHDPNGRCKEWCELNGAGQYEGTGQLCCVSGAGGACHPQNIFYP